MPSSAQKGLASGTVKNTIQQSTLLASIQSIAWCEIFHAYWKIRPFKKYVHNKSIYNSYKYSFLKKPKVYSKYVLKVLQLTVAHCGPMRPNAAYYDPLQPTAANCSLLRPITFDCWDLLRSTATCIIEPEVAKNKHTFCGDFFVLSMKLRQRNHQQRLILTY